MIAALTIAAAYGCAHDDPILTGSSKSNSTKGKQTPQDPNAGDDGEGDPNGGGDPGNGDDGGAQNNDDSGSTGGDGGGGTNCIDPAASAGDGHHNAGQDCISCHQSVSGANWTVAGTVYKSGSGVSGVTIVITDANGQTIQLVSCDNGNFYTDQNVAFPVNVRASSCPADTSMVSTAAQGSCNATGCHANGNRIHL
jgi:hypothetical protein